MTDAFIPDGPAPKKRDMATKFEQQNAKIQSALQRGPVRAPAAPARTWARYTVGSGQTFGTLWHTVTGFSLNAGGPVSGLTYNGSTGWTLGPGAWRIAASLRISSSTSAQIFCMSYVNNPTPQPVLGSELNVPNINILAAASVSFLHVVPAGTTDSLFMCTYITSSTVSVTDASVSFERIE